MNANEITFGVEIETTIPHGTLRVGPHGCGASIEQLPGWKADGDPSIRVTVDGHTPCEFVSPVFRGTEGLKQLMADLEVIRGFGAQVNASCGLHIHVGFNKRDDEAMKKLITLVANFEKAIFATTGTKAREQGRWCGSIKRHGNADDAWTRSNGNRYHMLNTGTSKPTVEFRPFAATLNPVKLAGYVRICVGLVERALKAQKKTNWSAKTPKESSPIHRNGEGQTEVTRLFYQIGWIRGRTDYTYGALIGEGIPDLVACKKELMRLARKYDSRDQVAAAAHSVVVRRGRLEVGMTVRLDLPDSPWSGQIGQVVALRRRCQPVVELASGQRYRVARRFLTPVSVTN
jgi:hypothetical protein